MTPTLGVLMLDTKFPRLPGDIGNPASWPGEVLFHIVREADVSRVVLSAEPDPTLLAPFLTGAVALEAEGAELLTTSCGFLGVFQDALAAVVRIPVMASSLRLGPLLASSYGSQRPLGIVTANSATLGPPHLDAARITTPVVIAGFEGETELARAVLRPRAEQSDHIDRDLAEGEIVAICKNMLVETPEIPAFLFECTNLEPYADAVRQATARPVYTLLDALRLLADK